MRRLTSLLLAALSIGTPALAADHVGFARLHLPSPGAERIIEGAIWYPAATGGDETLVGDNPVLVGQHVWTGAEPVAGRHPLVLISHGYGGNWTNQGWLAVDLVHHGYVVAAIDHPGTTTKDMSTAAGAALWERPRDLSRTLDALTRRAVWSRVIDADHVAAVGHSLGGWTVLELAGARFDPDLFDADCAMNAALAACEVFRKLGVARGREARSALAGSLTDPRVKAVVSLDLGASRGFDPGSLAKVAVPVLVVAAGTANPQIPAALESRHMFGLLPAASTRSVELATAAHFSFLPVCKPGAEALLAADTPDDVVVCRDGSGGNRDAIHRQVADQVTRFLDEALSRAEPPVRGSSPDGTRSASSP